MSEFDDFPPLPATLAELNELREWNLEMIDAWYLKKDTYIREYNILCFWGDEVARGGGKGTAYHRQALALTWSPFTGSPDRRLCPPEAWFVLVEEVKRHLPQNRLRHCYERLLHIRQDGINQNFSCGSHKLALDAQAAACGLISLPEQLENRLVVALNRVQQFGTSIPEQATVDLTRSKLHEEADATASKRLTTDELMQAEMAANLSEVKGFTAEQWAKKIGRSKGTVGECKTWKELALLRQQAKAERAVDRRQNNKRRMR